MAERTSITLERLKEVLSYNAETGVFTWRLNLSNRQRRDAVAGCICKQSGYRLIGIEGKVYKASRLAWFMVHGEWPSDTIDHVNTVRDDDRLQNLRLATRAENQRNRTRQKNNTSGFKGVHWHPQSGMWRARIVLGGKHTCLGLFKSLLDAAASYQSAAEKLHGAFARVK